MAEQPAAPDFISHTPTPATQPSVAASVLRKANKMKSGVFADRVVRMKLSDIKGEHALVKELDHMLKLPFFPQPRSEDMTREIVRVLLERTPLLTCQEQGRVVCVGNIRLYRLATFMLDESECVNTFCYSGSVNAGRRQKLRQGLLIETFLLPAIFGRRPAEITALRTAWERAALDSPLWVGCTSFANLYRDDATPSKARKGARHG